MQKLSFLLLGLALFLSGCLTSNAPAPNLYLLHAQKLQPEQKEQLPVSIIVERPTVAAGLNTDRIALLKNDRRELDYYAAARWNGPLDKILQDFMIETFENSFDIVEVDGTGLHQNADYVVVTKVRDFQAEYEDSTSVPPMLRVTMITSVLKLPSKEPVGRIIKNRVEQAETNRLPDIISQMERLTQDVTFDILQDIKTRI